MEAYPNTLVAMRVFVHGVMVGYLFDPLSKHGPFLHAKHGQRRVSVSFDRGEFDACMDVLGAAAVADLMREWCGEVAKEALRGDA